jgi:hypothetical protein
MFEQLLGAAAPMGGAADVLHIARIRVASGANDGRRI